MFIKESDITFENFAYEWKTLYEGTGLGKMSTIRKQEIKKSRNQTIS